MTKDPVLIESRLTIRYQTTIPNQVREALQLQQKDKISYTILANGDVLLSRIPNESNKPEPRREHYFAYK